MSDFDKSEHIPSKVINRKLTAGLTILVIQSLVIIALLLHIIGLISIPYLP